MTKYRLGFNKEFTHSALYILSIQLTDTHKHIIEEGYYAGYHYTKSEG